MKEIKKITEEINNKVPDLSDKIAASVDWNAVKLNCETVKSEKAATAGKTTAGKPKIAEKRKVGFSEWLMCNKKAIFSLAACLIIIAVMIPVGIRFFGKNDVPATVKAEEYDIVIDVNPSIMLSVDKTDKVSAQSGLNEDGVLFLYNKKYVGMTADEATRAVTEEMKTLGLIKDGGTIRISAIKHSTKTIYEEKQSHAETVINSVLNADVTTVFLSDDELDKLEDYYKSHNVSGKEAELIDGLKNKVKELISAKTADIKTLAGTLNKYFDGEYGSEDIVSGFTDKDRTLLSDYCKKYGVNTDFDISGDITYEDLEDFIEDLEDSEEDLAEALEDIDDSDDDSFGETLKDLIEIVKEEIFNKEDD